MAYISIEYNSKQQFFPVKTFTVNVLRIISESIDLFSININSL